MLQFFDTLTDDSGNALLAATVVVTAYPGGGAATIYQSNGTSSPIANSTVVADITGQISFFAPDGAYILTYAYKGTQYKVRSPVQLLDPMGFVAATDTGSGANIYQVVGAQYPLQPYLGMKVEMKAAHTNTGASTLVWQSGSALAINQPGGSALLSGMIPANGLVRLEWDGAQFQLLGAQSVPYYGITAAEIAAGVTPTNFTYPELDVRRYGAAADGTTNDASALHQADLVAGGTRSINVVPVLFIGSATVVSSPINDTMAQIFTTNSQVRLIGANYIRPEWFGSAAGNITLAVNALPGTGGVIKLENKTYPPSLYVSATVYLSQQNVTLWGVGAPAYNSTTAPTGFVVGSGTIIQGPFILYANGFKIRGGLGIDSSAAVCAALYSGVAQDGFMHFQPSPGSPLAPGVDMQIDDLRAICAGPSAMVHAVLLENITAVKAKCIEGASAYHCVVSKGLDHQIGMIRAYNPGGEGYYVKSDSYAQGSGIQVGSVQVIGTAGTTQWGVLIQGATQVLSNVQIGRIQAGNCSKGMEVSNGGFATTDITIGDVISEGCTWGILFDNCVRTRVGSLIANNGQYAFTNTIASADKNCRVGTISAATMSGDALNLSGPVIVGSLYCDTVTGYAVNYANAGARCFMEGEITFLAPPTAGLTNINVGFLDGWTSFGGGNSPFGLTIGRGKVCLSGLIHGGSGSSIIPLSPQVYPPATLRLIADCYNGSAYASAEILVGSAGTVSCVNYTQASSYLSLDGVEYPIPY